MNNKQKRFCDEYLVDCNIRKAERRAGYSPKSMGKTGGRILRLKEAEDYIGARLKKLQDERTADAYEVLEYLTSVMRGEKREESLNHTEIEAKKTAKPEITTKDRIRAAELIGKRYGLFKEKLEAEKKAAVVIVGENGIV